MWFIALALSNSCHLVSCDWISHPRPHIETRYEGKPSEAEIWDGKKKLVEKKRFIYLFIYNFIYVLIYLFIKNDSHY